jgi:hypothetical protein
MTNLQKAALNVAVVAIAFLAPVHNLLSLSLGLVFADLILGVLAARKRGEKIESRKLRQTMAKIVAYELGIVFAFIIESNFSFGLPLVKIVGSVIGLTETKSVFENLHTITGVDFLQIVLQKLQPPTAPKDPKSE